MIFDYYSQTDPGLIRENNEDSVLIDTAHQVVVLADGMGGYNAGEVASAMATNFIHTELGRWMSEGGHQAHVREIKRAMEICVDNANRSIFTSARENPLYAGMGTTLVLGVFTGERAMIGHVGDSRCYRMRGSVLQQITRDHSLLQEQIDAGLISHEQAKFATHKNLVTRALGVEDAVQLDVNEYRVMDEDVYLFCSDGLSDMVSDEQIASTLMGEGTLEHMGKALVECANANGGRDNISVILAKARAKPAKRGLLSRMLGQQ
jgi:PPM family protein phosphatase